jgi:VWFA-related protein
MSQTRTLTGIRRVSTVVVVAALSASLGAQERPTFRSSVDLVAVDVQIVSSGGVPIVGLGPEAFTVSINNRRRRVVSAEIVRYDPSRRVENSPRSAPIAASGADAGTPAPSAGRVFVLAIDLLSFQAAATRPVTEAVEAFVKALQPTDLVGLYAFPAGPRVDPSTDHGAVLAALGAIVGAGDPPGGAWNRYQLTPSNIADLTAARSREPYVDPRDPPSNTELGRKVDEVCAYDGNPDQCRLEVVIEAQTVGMYEEGLAVQRLGAFRDVLSGLAADARRKTIALVSTGLMASDLPGGRPDLGDLGLLIGQEAARSNSTIYTLHLDTQRMALVSAASGRRPRPTDNQLRDSTMRSRALDRIAAASGGTMFTAVQGGGEATFTRVLDETSTIYLLGVEPDEADRDGRPRRLTVNVNTGQRGAAVRARSWVVIPKPGTDLVARAVAAPSAPSRPVLREPTAEDKAAWDRLWAGGTPPPRAPTAFDELYNAYAAGNTNVVVQALHAPDGFERHRPFMAASLNDWHRNWSPRRAAFALEVALIAIAQGRPNAHQFLTSAQRIVTSRPEPPGIRPEDDAFEVLFHRTALAILAALDAPRAIEAYLEMIAARVGLGAGGPLADSRLELAAAVAQEVQTLPLYTTDSRRTSQVWSWIASADDETAQRRLMNVLTLLDAASRDVRTRPEALVRRAFVLHRMGAHEDARAILDLTNSDGDPIVSYWRALVRGRVLTALDRPREAIAAYEEAGRLAPAAQTPAVALAALFATVGDHQAAVAQAAAARATSEDEADPWPQYWTGDARFLREWLAELRQARP